MHVAMLLASYVCMKLLYLPRTHMIGFVCRLSVVCCLSLAQKCNVSVNIAEKLASVCFELFGKAHERGKYCVLLATPMYTTHYVLSAHAHNLAQYVGKGRQQAARIIELSDHRYALTLTLQCVRGMCSVEL